MSAKIESGLWTTMWLPKKASTVIPKDSLVILDAGYVNVCASDTGATDKPILGVWNRKATAATDDDYASTTLVPVAVPIGPALVRATASGALAITDQGLSFDMTDGETVNEAASTYGAVTCVKFISLTEGIFSIGKSIYANVA